MTIIILIEWSWCLWDETKNKNIAKKINLQNWISSRERSSYLIKGKINSGIEGNYA